MKLILKWFAGSIVVLLLYFLSIGPVFGLAARGFIAGSGNGNDAWARWQTFHAPLIALADAWSPFARIMYGYIRLWQPEQKPK
jgi:hypothetical protein